MDFPRTLGNDSWRKVSPNDVRRPRVQGTVDKDISFPPRGKGLGLKDFANVASELGVKFDREFVSSLKDAARRAKLYPIKQMRTLACADVIETLLLRLNFYFFEDTTVWKDLKSRGITFGPLEFLREMKTVNEAPFGGSATGTVTYVSLYYAYKDMKWDLEHKEWFLWLMQLVEEKYLDEIRGLNYADKENENVGVMEIRTDLWNYLENSKRLSHRNEYAHMFSQSFMQRKRDTVRALTSTLTKDMTSDRVQWLSDTLEDLKQDPPFHAERLVCKLQIHFLESSLSKWRPPQPRVSKSVPRLTSEFKRSAPPATPRKRLRES